MTTPPRSLAALAKQLQNAIPKNFEHQFDAEAFLNGTWSSPFEERSPLPAMEIQNPQSKIQNDSHHPDCPDAPWNAPQPTPEQTPQPTSAFESDDTPSDSFKQPKNFCAATSRSGKPCRAYPRLGAEFCIFHDPGYAPNLRESAVRGGQASPARAVALGLDEMEVDLHHRVTFHAFAEAFLRMQLAGSIPKSQSVYILRTMQILERNLGRMMGSTEGRDCATYERALVSGLDAAPAVADRLETRDMVDRARSIEDTGARRQEFLKANEQFGHNQPRPARTPSPASQPFSMPPFRG